MNWRVKDYEEYYQERAAVYEFDGGLSRKDAEAKAEQDKRRLIDEHLKQKSENQKHGIV